MRKAFGFTIATMLIIVGALGTFMAIENTFLFSIVGIIMVSLVCLTFIAGWICLMMLLFSATKATISAGKGIGSLMSILMDKISNKKGE